MGLMSIDWIQPEPDGIFVKPAKAWIDPLKAKPLALVTHGHADHAYPGHERACATRETLAIMALRHGGVAGSPMAYGDPADVNGVAVSFHPAGHVLGSAQILLEYRGERVVVTGDYKRAADPTCVPFEPVPCDVLITEATFALPVFRHPPIKEEIEKLLAVRAENPARSILVGAYALGKAQRVIAELRRAGYSAPIYLHGAMEKMCALYEAHGVPLGDLRPATITPDTDFAGAIVICPPSALHDRWTRRFPDPILAMASGWMQIRQRARQRQIDLPLIISDHADWDALTGTLEEVNPAETWVTHGRADALVHWCEMRQRKAKALHLVGRDEEDEG
jgi:putative mRNA 3-end processing factor